MTVYVSRQQLSQRGTIRDRMAALQPQSTRSLLDSRAKTAISPAAVTQSPLDPLTVEQLRLNMQVSLQGAHYLLTQL